MGVDETIIPARSYDVIGLISCGAFLLRNAVRSAVEGSAFDQVTHIRTMETMYVSTPDITEP